VHLRVFGMRARAGRVQPSGAAQARVVANARNPVEERRPPRADDDADERPKSEEETREERPPQETSPEAERADDDETRRDEETAQDDESAADEEAESPRRPWLNRAAKIAAIVAGVAVVALIAWLLLRPSEAGRIRFHAMPVRRGDLVVTVSATGTIEPEDVVDVGAQVAGRIESLGKDKDGKPVDYGSPVDQDTVLAHVDDALYASDVAQAEASLAQAKASVTRAEADVLQFRARETQATSDWERAQKLGPSDALAKSAFEAYRAAFETARANTAVGRAAVTQAKSSVDLAQAALDRAKRNLGYTTIRSPVAGVVIDRRVNVGQTVVSSLNAPSLFLIAKDLHRMEVWASVNEADVARIHPKTPVRFTVDAVPGRSWRGEVGKVRLNATMTQNVVNYVVEISIDNSDGKLLPYLTANAQFEIERHDDVLSVPNAALRYAPPPEKVAEDARAAATAGRRRAPRRPASGPDGGETSAPRGRGTVWIVDGEFARPVDVAVGATDGATTEVAGDVEEGDLVVLGDTSPQRDGDAKPSSQADSGGTTNPFAPQVMRGGRRPQ